jgi:nucleotide-binding universal stress UspA family protein
MTHAIDTPSPVARERDTDGRLVGLVFDSAPPPDMAITNRWLIAIDDSDNALRALDQAIRQAGEMRACILHLVNAQPWLAKEAAEAELARRGWEATQRAREMLAAAGLPWRLHVAMGEAAERIAETAERIDCAGIIIGSHGLGMAKAVLLGSVTQQVLRLSRRPLLVVH